MNRQKDYSIRMNQCSRILNQLMRYGSIDHVKAKRLGVMNLAARVSELRALGLQIETRKERYMIGVRRRAVKEKTFEDDLFPGYRKDTL